VAFLRVVQGVPRSFDGIVEIVLINIAFRAFRRELSRITRNSLVRTDISSTPLRMFFQFLNPS